MPPSKQPIPPAAQPKHNTFFDAWNSSSTGHQRAENRLGGSTGWRQSRSMKLSHQFRSGASGGKRISDMVGAGSKDWDERAKALIPKDVRQQAMASIEEMVARKKPLSLDDHGNTLPAQEVSTLADDEVEKSAKSGIFSGSVIYINGSTYPVISDHKLKHLLAENGARIAIHLGRRQVTHVILGRSSGQMKEDAGGAGGSLAASKLQKEISRVGGCGVKYVRVEWVMESLKCGQRLPEASFTGVKVAAKGQKSVFDMLQKD